MKFVHCGFDHCGMVCRFLLSLVFLSGFGIVGRTALAQEVVPASAAQKTQPRKGEVDVERSRVYTFVGKTGFGHEHGVVGRLKGGSIRLGAKRECWAAGIRSHQLPGRHKRGPPLRAAQRRNRCDNSGRSHRQHAGTICPGHLALSDGHVCDRFGDSSAKGSTEFTAAVQLDGQFTLHGTTRPLRVIAVAIPESGGVRLRGSFTLMQRDFQITPFTKAFGAVGVTDKLRVYGDILLIAAAKWRGPRKISSAKTLGGKMLQASARTLLAFSIRNREP